ncbi:hypothetical protein [Streptococcus mutans]|jgi:hypothetical protein|uniref:hypothetical protein n=1 Tax=Streptococcus mutans TaxID=1309 RepID=UPI00189AE2F9|nr:hypothetical protein [Streptococcus mutans]MCB4949693.1 hypothetical protein [Streptococcus mutans]MCB4960835.1 hypothetical protein [Streptococcus mutans]MCB5078492.1 hypothetical protein [Streptococcus mutans]MCB5128080.1 hypothetical protein [Streptococcus mutans]MCB5130165.1 hypothetical protein [Streptococcus mutans]
MIKDFRLRFLDNLKSNKEIKNSGNDSNDDSLMLSSYLSYSIVFLIYAIIITYISYISINRGSWMYDYSFHMSRIVGLAQSLKNGDWLPNLNYVIANNSGYAVTMFYGNWQLYIPALVFLATKTATFAYSVYAFLLIYSSSLTGFYSLYQMSKSRKRAFIFALILPITIPFFGYGMVAAIPLIPLLFYSLYKVIYSERYNPMLLAAVISLLIQTHVISTIVLGIASAIFVLLNSNQLTRQKLFSFSLSLVIGLIMTSGYIFQYVEQTQSQTFFVSWIIRDFPFPAKILMLPNSVGDAIINYQFPIAIVIIVIGLVSSFWIKSVSRKLILMSLLLLFSTTTLIPWKILKYSFLGVFQYTNRLVYFLPIYVLMAACISFNKYLVISICIFQFCYYIVTQPYKYSYEEYRESIEYLKNTNTFAVKAFKNPLQLSYDTSGDEYLNLSVNHDDMRNGLILNQFLYNQQEVAIENVRQKYNDLEFDVSLKSNQPQTIVVPRIWYKGYKAYYSDKAVGTQPKIIYQKLSKEELAQYSKAKKPKVTEKALYNGFATISVSHSGHVQIAYKKTFVQCIGYTIEILAWLPRKVRQQLWMVLSKIGETIILCSKKIRQYVDENLKRKIS